jgi:organic hydroperoxide reductase OsmC/OhrA
VTGKRHDYQVIVTWTGNLGEGTASYTAYSRDHHVTGGAKPTIPGTADPAFRGDPTRWNPEELLVASLSQCHMLEFLAQAARAGVVVTRYVDEPSGTMVEAGDGGSFVEVILQPCVTVARDSMVDASPGCTKRPTAPATSRALWSFRYALRRSPKLTGARRVRREHRRRHPASCLQSLRASCPLNPTPLRSSHRPTQSLATCTTSVMSFATSMPRSGSTGGWVSLYRRHHFPRLPRVQENARAPSESGIHMSRSAIASSSWSLWQTTVTQARWALMRPLYRCRPLQRSWAPSQKASCKLRIAYRRHSRDSRACTFSSSVQPTLTPRWRGSRPLESLPAGVNRVTRPVGTGSDAKQVSIGFVEIDSEPGLSPEGRLALAQDGPADSSVSTAGGEHPNGAVELVESVLCVPDADFDDYECRYARYLQSRALSDAQLRVFDLGRSSVVIVRYSALGAVLPGEVPAALPASVGYGIAVQNLVATRELLERADFPVRESPLGGWYVPAEAALGAAVIFRSAHDA